jgi:Site-specific DNA methylase
MLLKAFSENEQRHLAELAWQTAVEKRVPVLISNHATDLTYDLYQHAVLQELQVKRTISRAGHTRQRVAELIARYEPHRLARKAG